MILKIVVIIKNKMITIIRKLTLERINERKVKHILIVYNFLLNPSNVLLHLLHAWISELCRILSMHLIQITLPLVCAIGLSTTIGACHRVCLCD